ncbi:MAG: helix-turn-helix domain-containing protein, partial [Promethearchaeota archaeon]
MIQNVIQKIDEILNKAKFKRLTFRFNKRSKYCFDFIVKKKGAVFLIKVFPNIDNLNQDIIKDIKSLSLLLKSKPICIGIKNRYQNLEDYTIYIRENLPFISLNTFENLMQHSIYPYILAKRGGGVIFIDGNLMKILREKKNISRKELSIELGVAKRTVCAYESESMRPSEVIARKIVDILEDSSIFRRINLFQWNFKFNFNEKGNLEEIDLNPFELHLQDIISDIGISAYWYTKGQTPFELSIYSEIESERNECTI